ncbi:MAG: preprotein translocase subunit YajC [Bacteroidales bacterium]|jgi:preprotein translocase subunit YajC
MNFLNILLMAQPQGEGASSSGGMGSSLIFLLVIFLIFYLFFIRPQTKRQKEQRKFRESLTKGQKIVTIGGIHGKIVEVQETTVTIEVENNVRIRIEKSAIGSSAQDQLSDQDKK